jgi:ribosomal protein S27E
MSAEHYVKRTIYVATCPKCGMKDTCVEHPPRERYCNECNQWFPFVAESYIGPDTFGEKS